MPDIAKYAIVFALVLVLIGAVIVPQVSSIRNNGDKGQKEQQKVDVLMSDPDAVTGTTVKNYCIQAMQVNSNLSVSYTNIGSSESSAITSGRPMPTDINDRAIYKMTSKTYSPNGELTTISFTQKDLSK